MRSLLLTCLVYCSISLCGQQSWEHSFNGSIETHIEKSLELPNGDIWMAGRSGTCYTGVLYYKPAGGAIQFVKASGSQFTDMERIEGDTILALNFHGSDDVGMPLPVTIYKYAGAQLLDSFRVTHSAGFMEDLMTLALDSEHNIYIAHNRSVVKLSAYGDSLWLKDYPIWFITDLDTIWNDQIVIAHDSGWSLIDTAGNFLGTQAQVSKISQVGYYPGKLVSLSRKADSLQIETPFGAVYVAYDAPHFQLKELQVFAIGTDSLYLAGLDANGNTLIKVTDLFASSIHRTIELPEGGLAASTLQVTDSTLLLSGQEDRYTRPEKGFVIHIPLSYADIVRKRLRVDDVWVTTYTTSQGFCGPHPCLDFHITVDYAVTNTGMDTLGSFWANAVLPGGFNCNTPTWGAYEGQINLQPGQTDTFHGYNAVLQVWISSLPHKLTLPCIWTTGPDWEIEDGLMFNEGCGSFFATSIENAEHEFSIFPNPATDQLYLTSQQPLIQMTYAIHTTDGRLVQRGSLTQNSIEVSALPSGIYLLEVSLPDGQRSVRKFTKQ